MKARKIYSEDLKMVKQIVSVCTCTEENKSDAEMKSKVQQSCTFIFILMTWMERSRFVFVCKNRNVSHLKFH